MIPRFFKELFEKFKGLILLVLFFMAVWLVVLIIGVIITWAARIILFIVIAIAVYIAFIQNQNR